MFPVLANFIGALLVVIVVKLVLLLVAIAYYTLAERKIMAAVQRRFGPNVVGLWGLLQPLADGLKLFGKELVIPSHANSRIFILAPLAVLTFALTAWYVIPFNLFDYSERMAVDTVVQLASNSSNCFSAVAARFSGQRVQRFLPPFHPLASQIVRYFFGLRPASSCRSMRFSRAVQKAFATKFSQLTCSAILYPLFGSPRMRVLLAL